MVQVASALGLVEAPNDTAAISGVVGALCAAIDSMLSQHELVWQQLQQQGLHGADANTAFGALLSHFLPLQNALESFVSSLDSMHKDPLYSLTSSDGTWVGNGHLTLGALQHMLGEYDVRRGTETVRQPVLLPGAWLFAFVLQQMADKHSAVCHREDWELQLIALWHGFITSDAFVGAVKAVGSVCAPDVDADEFRIAVQHMVRQLWLAFCRKVLPEVPALTPVADVSVQDTFSAEQFPLL
jgi:hypothetical protein